MKQEDLFNPDPPYQRHSATSKEAAALAKPDASTQRQRVLAHLLHGPATDEQMQDALALNPSTQRPRRVELVTMGLVVDSGKTAKTRSGRNAVLWQAKP